jgi:hypothetical protein
MLINWLLYPVLLTLASAGHGLLVRSVARGPSNLTLLPVGFASMIVLSTMAMSSGLHGAAWLAIVVPALLGFALRTADVRAWRQADRSLWLWPAAAGGGAFLIFALPVVFSGHLTFTGFSMITDTANHFDVTNRLMAAGKVTPLPVDSSYDESVRKLFDANYPIGLHSLLGSWSELLGREVAWMYQPTVAFGAPMGALAAFGVLRWVGLPVALRAFAATVVVQPNLLYAYGLAAGFKEFLGAVMILTVLALLVEAYQATDRRIVAAAVPLAGGICVFTVTIAPWVGLVLLVFLVVGLAWPGLGRRSLVLRRWTAMGIAAVLLSWPLFPSIRTSSEVTAGSGGLSTVVTSQTDLGNLAAPLDPLTSAGVWLNGDYRYPLSTNVGLTHALVYIVLALALLGAVSLLWRRRPEIGAATLAAAVVMLVVPPKTGPWVDAKVYAVTGTLVLLLAFAGAGALAGRRRTVPLAWLFGLVIGGGVLYGNALAVHNTTLAPERRLNQLADIAKRFEGQGPALAPSFDENAEYFLRDLGAVGRVNPPQGFAGDPPLFGADTDQIGFDFIQSFRLLVIRRNPSHSRPPGNYELAYRTSYYDVWRREAPQDTIISHSPLPGERDERTPAACRELAEQLAAVPEGGRLRWSLARRPIGFFPMEAAVRSPNWPPDPTVNGVRTSGPGKVNGPVIIDRSGRFALWLTGSVERPLTVRVDNRDVATLSYRSDYPGEAMYVTTLDLGKGVHTVELRRGGGSLRPGNGDATGSRYVGPLLFDRTDDPGGTTFTTPVSALFDVCRSDRPLDWVELLRRSA